MTAAANMSKIRINELARELEVKPSIILDMLPELGVQDKKTHSSSLDDDVALALRKRLAPETVAPHAPEPEAREAAPEKPVEPAAAPAPPPPAPPKEVAKEQPAEQASMPVRPPTPIRPPI